MGFPLLEFLQTGQREREATRDVQDHGTSSRGPSPTNLPQPSGWDSTVRNPFTGSAINNYHCPSPGQVRFPPLLRGPPRTGRPAAAGPRRPGAGSAPGPRPSPRRRHRTSLRGEGRASLNLSCRQRMGENLFFFFPLEFNSRPRYQQIRTIRTTFLIFALLSRLATPKFPNPLKQNTAGHMLSPVTKVRAAHRQGRREPRAAVRVKRVK